MDTVDLYTSFERYLPSSGVTKLEVTMWSVAAGLFLQEVVRQRTGSPYGGLQRGIGVEIRNDLGPVSILDMCCGGGGFVNYLALMYPNIVVTGIDSNQAFVDAARLRFGRYGWTFIHVNATRCHLGRTFDMVTAAHAYHHIDDTGKIDFLRTMERHLGPDGGVIMCETFLPSYATLQERARAIDRYYDLLEAHYRATKASAEARDGLRQTRQLEISGHEEHKTHYAAFCKHLNAAGLTVDTEVPVWQPETLRPENAGSLVLLLRRA
jgi:2-polyprenyl-3-methyl-5-hydroxy-6-metoxy-1,4-benzoquinol methylase